MRFNPKSESEIQAERAKFQPLPQGVYNFEVISAEDKVSKAGNEMLQVVLKCYGNDDSTRMVYDYIMEAIPHKLRHFAYAVGLGVKYEAGSLTADDCLTLSGKVKLTIKSQAGYPPKNEVADYITPEGYQEQKQAVGTAVARQGVGIAKQTHAPIDDSDIPFDPQISLTMV